MEARAQQSEGFPQISAVPTASTTAIVDASAEGTSDVRGGGIPLSALRRHVILVKTPCYADDQASYEVHLPSYHCVGRFRALED